MSFGRLALHAAHTLRSRPLHTVLLVLCLSIGVLALAFVRGLAAGVDRQLQTLIAEWRQQRLISSYGRVKTNSEGLRCQSNTLTSADLTALSSELGARAVFYPRQSMAARLSANGSRLEMNVDAFGPAYFQLTGWLTADGESISQEDDDTTARVCLLGSTVARKFFAGGKAVGSFLYINDVPFRVKGTLEPRGLNAIGEDQDERAFIPVSTALRRVFCVDGLRGIGFAVLNPADDDFVTHRITEILRDRHHLRPGADDDFDIVDPKWLRRRYAGAFRTKFVLGSALTVVAAFIAIGIIANAMMVSVHQRRQEIGLKRALGATRKAIAFEIFLESFVIAIAGALLAIVLFSIAARAVPRLSEIAPGFSNFPLAMTYQGVAEAIAFAIAIGILAAALPARAAARLTPVEALRS